MLFVFSSTHTNITAEPSSHDGEDDGKADDASSGKASDTKQADDEYEESNDEKEGKKADDRSSQNDADRVYGPEEYPFENHFCDYIFTMIDRCDVSRRLHKEYHVSAKSASIVAVNYWEPLGAYRQWGE